MNEFIENTVKQKYINIESIKHRVSHRVNSTQFGRTVKYCDNWWDAFKDRWFPKWLQTKFPVNYKTVVEQTSHISICPHIDCIY